MGSGQSFFGIPDLAGIIFTFKCLQLHIGYVKNYLIDCCPTVREKHSVAQKGGSVFFVLVRISPL